MTWSNPFYNWCQCSVTVTNTPLCPNDGTCVIAPDMLVEDSVYPCGADVNGVITITDKYILPTGVDASQATFEIYPVTPNLINLTITKDEITFTADYDSTDPASNHLYGKLKYRIRYNGLSDTGEIVVIFKNRCTGVTEPSGQYCDPCTGNLVTIPVDISVDEGTTSSGDVSVD